MRTAAPNRLVRVASLGELQAAGRLVVRADRHTVCLFADGDQVHAVDNRCPHMGFPLHRGTVCDGILTCHWHHARFDLATGGTFDQFADELRRFPVTIDGDDVLIDAGPLADAAAHQRKRLGDGLERDIPLVLAKATIALLEADPSGVEVFRAGLDFGVARRGGGWFRGLTTLTCLMNLLPRLDPSERAPALYHGLADVAADSAAEPPRFPLDPLPGPPPDAGPAGAPGSATSSRCATPRGRSGRSSRRSAAAPGRRRSPTCCSPPPPTTATWTAATRSTSSTRRWRRSTPPAGTAPRRCSPRCPPSWPAPSGWRRRTPGATRSTWSRCSRPPSRSCRARSRTARPAVGRSTGPRSWRRSWRTSRRPSSRPYWRQCARAPAPSSSPRRSASPPSGGSPASPPATSSATGTPPFTRSRSQTRSSRDSAARRRRRCCGACSTPRSASTSTAS